MAFHLVFACERCRWMFGFPRASLSSLSLFRRIPGSAKLTNEVTVELWLKCQPSVYKDIAQVHPWCFTVCIDSHQSFCSSTLRNISGFTQQVLEPREIRRWIKCRSASADFLIKFSLFITLLFFSLKFWALDFFLRYGTSSHTYLYWCPFCS